MPRSCEGSLAIHERLSSPSSATSSYRRGDVRSGGGPSGSGLGLTGSDLHWNSGRSFPGLRRKHSQGRRGQEGSWEGPTATCHSTGADFRPRAQAAARRRAA
nr:unnamed protein product [Digitaria exilis]